MGRGLLIDLFSLYGERMIEGLESIEGYPVCGRNVNDIMSGRYRASG